MTSQYRHRRTSNPATAFPNPLEPGEIAVNTANRQIAVGDAASGAVGTPLPLLALRYFDARAQYVVGDYVIQGVGSAAVVYRANTTVSPGAFNVAQWDFITGGINPAYVLKSGSTMTGPLVLPGDPVNPLEATDKHYVDTALANKSSVIVSDTPPAGVIDNTLWFESDTGFTYLMFNDGTSRQWVLQAGPPPDTSQFVQRTGDTMSGKLIAPTVQVGNTDLASAPHHMSVQSDTEDVAVTFGQNSTSRMIMSWHWNANPALGTAAIATNGYSAPLSIDASVLNLQSLSGGIVTAPTMPAGNNTSAVANTTFVQNATKTAPLKKNYIINGAMMVSQENGTGVGSTTNFYPVDMFFVSYSNAGVLSCAQTTLSTGSITPAGSPNRFQIGVTTADTSVGAGDYLQIAQNIEGLRFADLKWGTAAAKTVILQFGVRAPAGTYCVSFTNGSGGGRCYIAEYVIAVGEANTDVVKSAVIPGDVSGTWAVDNTASLVIHWALMCGATFQQAAGSWGTASAIGSANQFNFMGTAGNVFNLFDVSLTEGTVAPPFVVPDYASELAACRRYFQKYTNEPMGWATVANIPTGVLRFPQMQAFPTLSNGAWIVSGGATGVVSVATITATSIHFYNSSNNWTVGVQLNMNVTLSARL